jgi:hypothetical protein
LAFQPRPGHFATHFLPATEGDVLLCVHLFNSPPYYGQFNASHERIHRTLKQSIEDLATHRNLTRVVLEIEQFREDYNHTWPLESHGKKTPAELYYCADQMRSLALLGRMIGMTGKYSVSGS